MASFDVRGFIIVRRLWEFVAAMAAVEMVGPRGAEAVFAVAAAGYFGS